MRRGVTVLVVVVVAAIALAAGIDALRGGSDPAATAETETERQATTSTEAASSFLEEQFRGVLYYTDESCELQATELSPLAPAEAPAWDECRFVLSPDATSVSGAGSAWDPTGDHLFHVEGGQIVVLSSDHEPEGVPFPGTAAAWRPDGTLTYYANGAVRSGPSGEVVLSSREIERALASHLFEAVEVTVKELAWMGDERLALIVALERATQPDGDVVTIFDEGRLVGVAAGASTELSDLRASPQGTFLAVKSPPSFELLSPDGQTAGVPPLSGVRAVTFSPDERWAAAATDNGIYVFRPGSQEWIARLELDANDLAWRGPAGPLPLANAEEARAWLADVRAIGRLFVTDADCRLRALVLPTLLWEWEAEPGVVLPTCRFNLTADETPVDEGLALQPQGELRAYCEGDDLEVYVPGASTETLYENACGPAWTPSGRLTFIRDGELYAGELDGGERLLISREALRRMFGDEVALEEVAWIDDLVLWAVVRAGGGASIATLQPSRLDFVSSFRTRMIEGLQVNLVGGLVAARTDRGVVIVGGRGRRPLIIRNGLAITWAPDAAIAAVATPRELVFVEPASRESVSVPLTARDLEWVVP